MLCPNCKKEAGNEKFCPACWALVYMETEVFPAHKPACAQENEAIFECEHLPSEFLPAEPAAMPESKAVLGKQRQPEPPPPARAAPVPMPVQEAPAPAACPYCKSPLLDQAKFCGKCGAVVGQTSLPAYRPPPQPQSPAPAKPPAAAQPGCMTVLAVVSVFVGVVILICVFVAILT